MSLSSVLSHPAGLPAQTTPEPDSVVDVYEQLAGTTLGFIVGAIVVYLLGRLVLVPAVVRVVRSRNRNNPTVVSATETYVHAGVVLFAVGGGVVGAGYGDVLTDSALILAALTVVLGVAGQEVIGSLISGLFLVADPDFNVGDWIAWSGGEGIVEAVDFRVTRVQTVNNETITVPNTELTTNALTRPYGRNRYRVTESVSAAYDDDVELALKELVEVAREDDRVLEDPTPEARILDLGENYLDLQAEFWLDDPMDVDLPDVRSAFRRRAKARFDEVGLTLGPTSDYELSGGLAVDLASEGEAAVGSEAGDSRGDGGRPIGREGE